MAERSRGQLIGYALALVLLVVAGFQLVGNRKKAEGAGTPVEVAGADRAPSGAGGAGSGASERRVYVHVAGAVKHPGLYRVRASGRVAGAVARAGGPARHADLAGVNLAAPLQDGQQVIVPAGGAAAGGASGGGGGGHAGGHVSLGSASAEDLDGLDGIGPTLAKRIVDYRQAHGGFRSVDDLREVEGIGEKRLAALRKALNP
jgi:competence protein ComEA